MDAKHLPAGYERSVERPAALISAALNIVLGVALIITMIVKVYMAVLTDHACAGDIASLGNTIRCQSALEIITAYLAVGAGFAIAFAFFSRNHFAWVKATMISLLTALAKMLSIYATGDYNWRLTLATVCLSLIIAACVYAADRFGRAAE